MLTTDSQVSGPELIPGRVLQERLAALRERTDELRSLALQAAERSRAVRASSGHGCNHARELQDVQTALETVQGELDGLHTAMRSRAVIEQAKGMLMAERKVGDEEAFAILVNLSQTTHRKLVHVATALVDAWKAPAHDTS